MNIFFDYSNMIKDVVGVDGIDLSLINECSEEIRIAHKLVEQNKGKGWYGWCELPYRGEDELSNVINYAEAVRENAESFVVFGIGGSALGPLAVATSLLHLRHNELPKEKRRAPKFYIEDNIDPERINSLLDVIDMKSTYFNFITKSGETSETLSQFLIIYKLLKEEVGEDEARKRIAVSTTIGKGSLYEIAKSNGLMVFNIESGVGGRFSVLSNVGLVPFAVLGLDIRMMLRGARIMSEVCLDADINKNPALMSAFLHVAMLQDGKNISVMMPYADSLRYMSDFFAQLWGESLGKEKDIYGNVVRCGQTPVKALGVTDQHSQIQLYVEGPRDKIVTFIALEHFRDEIIISRDITIDQGGFLMGNTMSKLIDSERIATTFALTKAGCPNYTITLPEVNEGTIGQLLTYFMYQTAYAGALMNIDAFNQPGVEEGKKATFAILGRNGYEEKLKEIIEQKQNKYIITMPSED